MLPFCTASASLPPTPSLLLVIPPVLFHNQGARAVFAIVEAPGRTHVRLHSTEVNDVIVAVNVAVTVGTRKVSSSLPANTLRMTHVLSSGSKRAGMRVRVTANVVVSTPSVESTPAAS